MHIQHALYGLIISASVFSTGAASKKCRTRTSTPISAVTTPVATLSASPESSQVSPSESSSVSSAIVADSSTRPGSQTLTSALDTPTSSVAVSSSSTLTPESSATSPLESDSTTPTSETPVTSSTPILSTSTPEVSSESITSASTSLSSASTLIPSSTSSAIPPPCSPASDTIASYLTTYNTGNGVAIGEPLMGIPAYESGTFIQVQFYSDAGYGSVAFKIEACTGRVRLTSSDIYPDNYLVTSASDAEDTPAAVGVTVPPLADNLAYIKCSVPVMYEPYQCQDESSGKAITFYTLLTTTQPKLYASTAPGMISTSYTLAELFIIQA